jgi:hypothetical protein
MQCDNYVICLNQVMGRDTVKETLAVARAHGWHIFDGLTSGGDAFFSVLCPTCVGKRARLDPAPKVLEGQLELDL